MTANSLVTIFCDHEGCGQWSDDGIGETAKEARANLRGRNSGWLLAVPEGKFPGFHGRHIARDYCPQHAAEHR